MVAAIVLLVAIGEAWRTVSRRGDMMARLGGDEFAVMLPDCSLEEAHAVIERVSAEVRKREPDLECGISAGFALSRAQDGVASLLDRADRAMYAQPKQRRAKPAPPPPAPVASASPHEGLAGGGLRRLV